MQILSSLDTPVTFLRPVYQGDTRAGQRTTFEAEDPAWLQFTPLPSRDVVQGAAIQQVNAVRAVGHFREPPMGIREGVVEAISWTSARIETDDSIVYEIVAVRELGRHEALEFELLEVRS